MEATAAKTSRVETLAKLSPKSLARFEWRARMIRWLAPRLIATEEEDFLQFTDMWDASMSKSYAEGIEDAVEILERLAATKSYRVVDIAIKALRDLNAKNKADGV